MCNWYQSYGVSPSHRRGTLKCIPTVKAPTSFFEVTVKSLLSHLKVTPFLGTPFSVPLLWDGDTPHIR